MQKTNIGTYEAKLYKGDLLIFQGEVVSEIRPVDTLSKDETVRKRILRSAGKDLDKVNSYKYKLRFIKEVTAL